MAERSTIIERIRKLLALGASTTFESEAFSAAAKAADLMAEYGLSEADVSEDYSPVGFHVFVTTARVDWVRPIAVKVAQLYGTVHAISEIWDGTDKHLFIGREPHSTVASMVFRYLMDAVTRSYRSIAIGSIGEADPMTFERNFRQAAAIRIARRLEVKFQELVQPRNGIEPSGGKNAVVLLSKHLTAIQEGEDFLKALGARYASQQAGGDPHSPGWQEGVAAGESIGLDEQVRTTVVRKRIVEY